MKHSPSRNTGFLSLVTLASVSLVGVACLLPALASAAQLSGQLDLGMQNADVTSLQTFLATIPADYPSGLITGYYGSMTAAAVSAFQRANGLDPVGRVGPQTLAAINAQMGGGGGVVGTSGDIDAPIMSPEIVTTTSNSATFTWSTNEAAIGRVLFGTTWPFLYATAPSVSTNTYSTNANITLTGLQSNTQYYYVIQSTDSSGNLQETIGKPFHT